jgi:hypothetical protein
MFAFLINRHRRHSQSAKESLRAHIDQLSFEEQRQFVLSALQLMAARPQLQAAEAPIGQRLIMRRRSMGR